MAKVKEGVVLAGLSGRAGNAVFVSTAQGTVLRDRPMVNDPRTPLQRERRDSLARVGQVWKSMTVGQAAAWRAYAELAAGSSNDERVPPNLVFTRLSMKFLQVHPAGEVPIVPPSSLFPGDAVRFEVSSGESSVRIKADVANAPGVVTEVLLQPLASVHRRTYVSRYRSAGFFAFEQGQTHAIPVPPGIYAVATRFVYAPTGEATNLIEQGIVG